jgi:hypothetical protein
MFPKMQLLSGHFNAAWGESFPSTGGRRRSEHKKQICKRTMSVGVRVCGCVEVCRCVWARLPNIWFATTRQRQRAIVWLQFRRARSKRGKQRKHQNHQSKKTKNEKPAKKNPSRNTRPKTKETKHIKKKSTNKQESTKNIEKTKKTKKNKKNIEKTKKTKKNNILQTLSSAQPIL